MPTYEQAVALSYAWIWLPLLIWLFEPRRNQFIGWLLVAALVGAFAPDVTYDSGIYEPNIKDAVYALIFLWSVFSFPLLVFDMLGSPHLFSTHVDLAGDTTDGHG